MRNPLPDLLVRQKGGRRRRIFADPRRSRRARREILANGRGGNPYHRRNVLETSAQLLPRRRESGEGRGQKIECRGIYGFRMRADVARVGQAAGRSLRTSEIGWRRRTPRGRRGDFRQIGARENRPEKTDRRRVARRHENRPYPRTQDKRHNALRTRRNPRKRRRPPAALARIAVGDWRIQGVRAASVPQGRERGSGA